MSGGFLKNLSRKQVRERRDVVKGGGNFYCVYLKRWLSAEEVSN